MALPHCKPPNLYCPEDSIIFSWILQMKNDKPGFRPASFAICFGVCGITIVGMKRVHLRFYEELNDHLPEDKKKRIFACCFAGELTVATLLKATGVPISEVDLVLRSSEPVSLAHIVQDGDRISVYPVFELFDLKGITRVRDEPLRQPVFATGPGLARLAAYMRMLGFDTCSSASSASDTTVKMAQSAGCILLARGLPLPHAGRVFRVRGTKPRHQALEVIIGLSLRRLITPLGRCPRCNSSFIRRDIPVRQCMACGFHYGDGPHLRRMQRLMNYLSQPHP
jgi:uncharacterized protein with PIN domain/sulfur carrier protein ThiS